MAFASSVKISKRLEFQRCIVFQSRIFRVGPYLVIISIACKLLREGFWTISRDFGFEQVSAGNIVLNLQG